MVLTELTYAIRRLRNSPTFTGAAVITLAIAIGATASVFAVVDAAMLKPFPFMELDRVLMVVQKNEALHHPIRHQGETHAYSRLGLRRASGKGSSVCERSQDMFLDR